MRSFSYIFKAPVAFVALVIGIFGHLFFAAVIIATTAVWVPFSRFGKNPAYLWAYVYYWWLRSMFVGLGITVRIYAPEDVPDGPVTVLADHGSTIAMLLQAVHVAVYFPRRAKIGIKQELMNWPVGWALVAMGAAVVLPRENREESLQRIEAAAGGESFTGMIYTTGHRFTHKRLIDGRTLLTRLGYDASKLRFTCVPKPGGSYTLLRVQQPRVVYLQMVAASQSDEGFAALLHLMYGGAIILRYQRISPDMTSEAAFAHWSATLWLDRVNPWIGETRVWWGSLSSVQAHKYFWRQLRFWR